MTAPRRPASSRPRAVPVAALASLLLVACELREPQAAVPDATTPLSLPASVGETLRVDLAPGEERVVVLDLDADRYLELAVDQRGIDVLARLEDPMGASVVVSDRPIDDHGEEVLVAVTGSSGSYRLVLEAGTWTRGSGRVEIDIRRLELADETARRRAAAARHFAASEEARWAGDHAAARRGYEAALAEWRRLGDRFREAETRERLGRLAAAGKDWDVAVEHHAAASELFAALGETRWQAMTVHHLGVDRYFQGRLGDAIELYHRALPLRREGGDLRGEAITHHVLAQAFQVQDELQAALDHHHRSLDLLRLVGDLVGQARTLHNLGVFYAGIGRRREARDALEAADTAWRAAGEEIWRGATLNQLGELQEEDGDLDGALATYREALELRREAGDQRGVSSSLVHLSRVQLALGDAELAWALGEEALAIADALDRPRELAKAVLQMGRLHMAAGRADEATVSFRRAAALYAHVGDVTAEADAYDGLAAARRVLGDLDGAQAAGEHALVLDETVRPRALAHDLRADYFATVQLHFDHHLALLAERHRRQPGAGWDASALEVSERARARSLIDLLADRVAQPATFAELRREVTRDDTLLLSYRLGEAGSHLWILSADDLELVALPPRAVIAAAAETAYSLLPRSQRREGAVSSRHALCRLSRLLLAPAAGRLHNRRLAVVADGPLHYLPFAALPDPRAADCATAPPLVERHQIVSLPSASALVELRRARDERQRPSGVLAVVADPVFGADDPRLAAVPGQPASPSALPVVESNPRLRRLEGSRQEARALLGLARRAGASPAETLSALGFEARRELVASGALSRFRFVHFATHGLIDTHRPEQSGVVLTRFDAQGRPLDGMLRATEVAELDLTADLVVLSACETALGEEVRGEGLVGLTQSFLTAGASSVVVTLWKVSDQMTAELMEGFYRGLLLDRLPPAAALRRAQREIRRRPDRSAPYAWAGFVVQGDWSPGSSRAAGVAESLTRGVHIDRRRGSTAADPPLLSSVIE